MKVIAEIKYRDDVGPEKPWGSQSVVVELVLRQEDGVLICREFVNESSALAWSPIDLLGKFIRAAG